MNCMIRNLGRWLASAVIACSGAAMAQDKPEQQVKQLNIKIQ